MDINSNFLKGIGLVADLLAIITVIAAIPFALINKNQRMLAFRISRFLYYMMRIVFLIIAALLLYTACKYLYFFILLLLKGSLDYDTALWEDNFWVQHLTAYFLTIVVGLCVAWCVFSAIWTSSWNLTREFVNLFLSKSKLLTKTNPPLEILSALYGGDGKKIDVIGTATKMIVDNKLTIKAANELFGDPDPGNLKSLVITYRLGQKTGTLHAGEGYTITIP